MELTSHPQQPRCAVLSACALLPRVHSRDGRSFPSMRTQAWTCSWWQWGVHKLESGSPGGIFWTGRDTLLQLEMEIMTLICNH